MKNLKRPEHSKLMTGRGNPMFGKPRSKKTKAKIRKTRLERGYIGKKAGHFIHGKSNTITFCKDCGKQLNSQAMLYDVIKCRSCAQKGHNPSKEVRQKMSEARKGKDNPNWQGGIARLPYPYKFTEELRASIRDRDNHKCQSCHISEKDLNRELNIHHIDYNKENCEEINLISLCDKCHSKTNGSRNYWTEFFTNLMKGILIYVTE